MNKLISSTLMTIVAVPFLMAAPAATKVQNSTAAPSTSTAKKTAKKHVKKAKSTTAPAAAPSGDAKK